MGYGSSDSSIFRDCTVLFCSSWFIQGSQVVFKAAERVKGFPQAGKPGVSWWGRSTSVLQNKEASWAGQLVAGSFLLLLPATLAHLVVRQKSHVWRGRRMLPWTIIVNRCILFTADVRLSQTPFQARDGMGLSELPSVTSLEVGNHHIWGAFLLSGRERGELSLPLCCSSSPEILNQFFLPLSRFFLWLPLCYISIYSYIQQREMSLHYLVWTGSLPASFKRQKF